MSVFLHFFFGVAAGFVVFRNRELVLRRLLDFAKILGHEQLAGSRFLIDVFRFKGIRFLK